MSLRFQRLILILLTLIILFTSLLLILFNTKKKLNKYEFIITDNENEITIIYEGILPDLFREGQGTVVEGILNNKKNIIASKVYAKHDENYMPASIKKELEKNNQWKKNYK